MLCYFLQFLTESPAVHALWYQFHVVFCVCVCVCARACGSAACSFSPVCDWVNEGGDHDLNLAAGEKEVCSNRAGL